MDAIPILKDLVLVGGGHAHVEVLRHFAMRPVNGARLTLVSSHSTSVYSGMLPGHVAGHYDVEDINIDLRRLARAAGARFIRAEIDGLDTDGRHVLFADRPPLAYDILSLNTGSVPDIASVDGASEHAIAVKPIDRFLEFWGRQQATGTAAAVGVVGGGAAGVEIVMALAHRLGPDSGAGLHLLEAGDDILPGHPSAARRLVREALARHDVTLCLGAPVRQVTASGLVLETGEDIALDAVVWATGAAAPQWLSDTGLALDARGFAAVERTLRSTSHALVFVAGDIASVAGRALPKAGVHAVRQGPPLAANLRRALLDRPLRPYTPQRRFLNLIATGDTHAIASRGGFALGGGWLWRLKDRIDRRFMARYAGLGASMTERPAGDSLAGLETARQAAAMRCAGCGSKLGASVLETALARLGGEAARPAEDAAILDPPPGKQVLQSIDYFPALVSDPYLFGQIAANHCLGDLFAMGAKPWTALALASVPPATDKAMSEDLFQMLAGGERALEAAGAHLVGGHSVEGDTLGLGFTVNGLADKDRIRRKGGLRPGDALILSKPLGTGVLFAAEMRGAAKPRWIDGAIETMLRPNAEAARILAAHGATAMTDITGFGLSGHLGEMLSASAVDACLYPDAFTLLEGVRGLFENGHASSLAPRNLQRLETLCPAGGFAAWEAGVLADPQTAGGLLAGIPNGMATDCVAALRKAGDQSAAVIGLVEPQRGTSPAIRRRARS